MGTKTIGIREDVYERLKAQKRPDESFTDTVDRLLDESTADWREGFGALSTAEAEELESVATGSRGELSEGLAARQQDVLDALSAADEDADETA